MRISWEVWTPPVRSATAAGSIFTCVWSWNDVRWPVVVLTDSDMMTIPVGLGTVLTSYAIRSAQIMAAVVLAALPVIVICRFIQRQIVRGIARTGIKD